MRKISRIEPNLPVLKPRKKAAAYCRVSMETEGLHRSLSAQVSYYNSLIQSNPEWEFAGVYVDYGISGAAIKQREKFQEMLADCRAGKIDIVLTKSISRFARNTVDLLNTVRELKSLGIEVRFEREHINSLSGDGELMLTILASFAQEERHSLSENIKWAARKKFQQGIPCARHKIYGYRWEEGRLVILPEEAEVVKRIFRDFLGGKAMYRIAVELHEEGVTTAKGGRWAQQSVYFILTNVTYIGNLLFQKQFNADPFVRKIKHNRGELPQFIVENDHAAIISKEDFELAQAEMPRRRELGCRINPRIYDSCFSGKIECGRCSNKYMRTKQRNSEYAFWVCCRKKRQSVKACGARNVPEEILRPICCDVLKIAEFDETAMKEKIEKIIVASETILEFHLADGRTVEKEWEYTPRRRRPKIKSK